MIKLSRNLTMLMAALVLSLPTAALAENLDFAVRQAQNADAQAAAAAQQINPSAGRAETCRAASELRIATYKANQAWYRVRQVAVAELDDNNSVIDQIEREIVRTGRNYKAAQERENAAC